MIRPRTPADDDTTEPAGLITSNDLWLFNQGRHTSLGRVLGSHPRPGGGTTFSVWAPNARTVSVIGDFNEWSHGADQMEPVGNSGIWTTHLDHAAHGHRYKYLITSTVGSTVTEKADPVAFYSEVPPRTASVIWDLDGQQVEAHDWNDDDWMSGRAGHNSLRSPISIYEMHLGSWRWNDDGEPLDYREAAHQLADHLDATGFTHVEFLPLMEHPFYGSWGYQTTGYFAPTARYGTPQDLMYLVDHLHQRGYGVILDWVPSHFPTDAHGPGFFDGTHLYEHADPRLGFHPDWTSFVFNYERHEVRSFLLSSAHHWLERFHIDGIRVDAVASMLYLDYSREDGEWIPNEHGGNENLGAIRFLQDLNQTIHDQHPGTALFAEESTAWPGVSRPVSTGGLGFDFKWDMGWMHDTLRYMSEDPVNRRYHHDELTFRAVYAFSENYTLPLSHDEVVHGKGSLLGKMPGDTWQRLANLRLLYGYQWCQPGKKLLFMGSELAQPGEWSHGGTVDWPMLDDEGHAGVQRWISDLNKLYTAQSALHGSDCDPEGFAWSIIDDHQNSVIAFWRREHADATPLLFVGNFTPVPRHDYRIGVPITGAWLELANSDHERYGGSGLTTGEPVSTETEASHGHAQSLSLTIPPLAAIVLAPDVAP